MKIVFEIKKSWKIEINEEEFIEAIEEAMEDFPAPDSDFFNCLDDWASEIIYEDCVRTSEFIRVDGYWECLNDSELFDPEELYAKINEMLHEYLLDWIAKNWG